MRRQVRRVIQIRAVDSPNVRLALAQLAMGREVTHEIVTPNVLTYAEYLQRRATWSKPRQSAGLDAAFYEGAEELLWPPQWLDAAEEIHRGLAGLKRVAKGIGGDTGEGKSKTTLCAVDEYGIIEILSKATPDTSVIRGMVKAFVLKHACPHERVCLDRGGGGYELACDLQAYDGMRVRTVAFGESLSLDPKRGLRTVEEKLENKEERYVYVNRRAQMFYETSWMFDPQKTYDPNGNPKRPGYGMPAGDEQYAELRRQLEVIPRLMDREGRYKMLPKNNPDNDEDGRTLVKLIGHSPDEADSLVLAVHAMLHKKFRATAGAPRR